MRTANSEASAAPAFRSGTPICRSLPCRHCGCNRRRRRVCRAAGGGGTAVRKMRDSGCPIVDQFWPANYVEFDFSVRDKFRAQLISLLHGRWELFPGTVELAVRADHGHQPGVALEGSHAEPGPTKVGGFTREGEYFEEYRALPFIGAELGKIGARAYGRMQLWSAAGSTPFLRSRMDPWLPHLLKSL